MFDPNKHICRFGFESYDYCSGCNEYHRITVNLYTQQIIFEFVNWRTDEVVEAVWYKFGPKEMNELLSLIVWDDFEPYRDLPSGWRWDTENGCNGYRDGWGYHFWCLTENGAPLLQVEIDVIFRKDKLPPYERLLHWINVNYSKKKRMPQRPSLWNLKNS